MDVQLTSPCMEKTSFMSIYMEFQLFFGAHKSLLSDFLFERIISPTYFPYEIELNKIFNT